MSRRRRAAPLVSFERPEFVGWKVATSASITTSGATMSLSGLTGGIDTAPSVGDLLLVSFGAIVDSDATLAIRKDDTSGADYTLVGSEFYVNGGIDTNLRIGYRFHDGDTSCFLDTSTSTLPALIFLTVWRGVDTSNPIDVTPTTSSSTSTSLINAPAITPSTPNSTVVFFGTCAEGTSIPTYLTYSGTATDSLIGYRTQTTDTIQGIAGYYEWTGGSYDPESCGGTTPVANRSYAAMTLALRPAS